MLPAPGFTPVSLACGTAACTEEDILSLGVSREEETLARTVLWMLSPLRCTCFPGTGLCPQQRLAGLIEMETPIGAR